MEEIEEVVRVIEERPELTIAEETEIEGIRRERAAASVIVVNIAILFLREF